MSAITRDPGDLQRPTPPFSTVIENKDPTANRPLRRPCVAHGWPLGDAWVALRGPIPIPNPIPIGRGSQLSMAARRKTGAPDEPGFGLTGWNFAAPQTVIGERPATAGSPTV